MNAKKTPIALILSLLVTVACFSCSDDTEDNDPYRINYVYMRAPANTDLSYQYTGSGNFLTAVDPVLVLQPVRTTKPVPEDLVVNLEIDTLLLKAYNATADVSYTLLKSAELQNATLHIPKGGYMSADTPKVYLKSFDELRSGAEHFLLPIRIKSVSSRSLSISNTSVVIFKFTSQLRMNFVSFSSDQFSNTLIFEQGRLTNSTGELVLKNALLSTMSPDTLVSVELAIDTTLVAQYNAQNNTNYRTLPNASLSNGTIVMEKGASNKQDISILFTEGLDLLNPDNQYMLPVVIKRVVGVGADTGDVSVAYIIWNTVDKVSVSVGDKPTHDPMKPHESWNVFVNGRENGSVWNQPWKLLILRPGVGDTIDMDYIKANQTLRIDLGESVENIYAVRMAYWKERAYYSARGKVSITYSNDSGRKLGECTVSSASEHTFVLENPVNARFIDIVYHQPTAYSGVSLSGIYVYKKE